MINKVGNTYDDIRRFEDDFRLIIYALYKCNDVRRRIEFFLFAHSSRGEYDIVDIPSSSSIKCNTVFRINLIIISIISLSPCK